MLACDLFHVDRAISLRWIYAECCSAQFGDSEL